jgi:HD-GYP domain-containing protein (c-di-GMP phosphodiesterase class II)
MSMLDPTESVTLIGFMYAHGAGGGPLARAFRLPGNLIQAASELRRGATATCEVGRDLARRLNLGEAVERDLQQVFERWDGRGLPARLRGDNIAPAVRLVQIAGDAELLVHLLGTDAMRSTVKRRRGKAYDPAMVDVLIQNSNDLWPGLANTSRDSVLAADPAPTPPLPVSELDDALHAFADFIDLKSPFTGGHSSGVASLAGTAGRELGLPAADLVTLQHAGLLHDVGRIGVHNGIWDKPGPLGEEEWEQVRLHPYLTERTLSWPRSLAVMSNCAAAHHERINGSGYHRGVRAADLTVPARVLAAADAFHAMLEPRAHRRAMPRPEAAATLRAGARAGKLDAAAVDAVLSVSGQTRRRASRPAGLSAREVEIIRLLAQGLPDKETARRLGISPRTVEHHVGHVYAKLGVTTRAAAALFAAQHGLLEPDVQT